MKQRPNSWRQRTVRAAALVGVLTMAGACSSDAVDDTVDDAEDAGDVVSTELDDAAEETGEAQDDLATVLEENGLENLASAVAEVDIEEMFGTDEFTFFAPDDEAFQSLSAGDIADVLTDPEQLDDVLRRHIVAETLDAAELADTTTVETEGGTSLDVTVDGDVVMVGDATVVRADIDVDNGVVHIVDRIFIEG